MHKYKTIVIYLSFVLFILVAFLFRAPLILHLLGLNILIALNIFNLILLNLALSGLQFNILFFNFGHVFILKTLLRSKN